MQPHQQRVVTELNDLDNKYEKLGIFLKGEIYKSLDVNEQKRLADQHQVMGEYADILRDRIAAFQP